MKCVLCKKGKAVIHIGIDREPPFHFCLDCIKIDGQIADLITMAKQMGPKGYIDGIGGDI